MKPAAERLAAAMADLAITTPSVPVVANVTAEPTQDPAQIARLLVQQVTAPVRWEESVQAIAKLGVTRGYELGAGAVLKGLVKRIAPEDRDDHDRRAPRSQRVHRIASEHMAIHDKALSGKVALVTGASQRDRPRDRGRARPARREGAS